MFNLSICIERSYWKDFKMGFTSGFAPAEPLRGRDLAYGERRQALIEATIRVVAKDGLRRVTYRSIAKEAGVSHGLLLHHFGSMDVLIEEALDFCIEDSLESISFVPDSIESFAHGIMEQVNSRPEAQEFQYEVMLESRRNKALKPAVALLMDGYRKVVMQGLSKLGIDVTKEDSQFVFSVIEGIVFHQLVAQQTDYTAASIDRLRALVAGLNSRYSCSDCAH